jgi:uncharacterized protein (UPF0335 family)
MGTKVKISFPINEKTITVEKEVGEHENIAQAVNALLAEIDSLEFRVPGKATPEQIRAIYGKAFGRGWDTDRVKSFLEERFGTSNEDEIVGKVDRMELARLIAEIGGAIEMPGKATVAQMRALWGKALGKGWDRERVRSFLEERLGTSIEEEIVGKIDWEKLSAVINEIDEF